MAAAQLGSQVVIRDEGRGQFGRTQVAHICTFYCSPATHESKHSSSGGVVEQLSCIPTSSEAIQTKIFKSDESLQLN